MAVASWQGIISQLSFLPGNFRAKATSPTLYFSLFPLLKIEPKGYHFDTIDMMEVELQVELNTLTEHVFQNAYKIW
jgi:hypothetical protein